ncbi:MAG: hypothetical protein ABIP16_02905, partial [Thermomonas sp.]
SLRGDDTVGKVVTGKQASGAPAWLRWGGGAAMAASLAVVAMMARPVAVEAPAAAAVAVMDAASPAANQMPPPNMPSADPAGLPAGSSIEQAAALATAVAAVARPARSNARNRGQSQSAQPATIRMQDPAVEVAANDVLSSMLPQADIVARPWPRSVLPNYGNSGITVGFDDSARNAAPYNPFQVRRSIGNLPPSLIVDTPAPDVATPANDETGPAANNEPQS